ncbi:hypothetical protein ACGFRB_08795 [Streptomyces sp. NPDC048718]|uniref:hypothetical protein n=1 Tax=Streptomyces sp. NPDC048718 TaxID=3365587 RepID=UPI00371B041D
MLGYWFAVVRRLAFPALTTGALFAVGLAALLIVGGDVVVSEAVPEVLGAGVGSAFAFLAILSMAATVGAARTARRYGLALGPEAVALPSVREVRVPGIANRTAFQLTDSVRYAIENDPAMPLDEVTTFGHGALDLTLSGPSDTKVVVEIRITPGPDTTTAAIQARPTATHKRLDSAASWAMAGIVERRTLEALHAEAAPAGDPA